MCRYNIYIYRNVHHFESPKVSGSKSGIWFEWRYLHWILRGAFQKFATVKAPSLHPVRCRQDSAPIPWTCHMREETPGNTEKGGILSVIDSICTTFFPAANRISSPTTAIRLFSAYKLEKLLKFEICWQQAKGCSAVPSTFWHGLMWQTVTKVR